MLSLKRTWIVLIGLLIFVAVAGCSGATASTSSSSGAGDYGPGSGAGAGGGPVKVGRTELNGKLQPVLTNAQERTLYYSAADSANGIACKGSCLNTWHPLLTTAYQIQTPRGLPGKLSVMNTANGLQVAYNGHPLYTYSGDSKALQTTGNNLDNLWHIATPSTPAASAG